MAKTFIIRCRENGDYITEFDTFEEAETILNQFAHEDMLEDLPDRGSPEWNGFQDERPYRDFYEIVESEEIK